MAKASSTNAGQRMLIGFLGVVKKNQSTADSDGGGGAPAGIITCRSCLDVLADHPHAARKYRR